MMIKLVVSVKDKKDGNSSVKIEVPKNIEKATDNEKSVAIMVYNKISEALQKLENEK